METTLSIRNVDLNNPIYLDSVQYFDTKGELVRNYLDGLIKLEPLESIEFLVERRDTSGGAGANFLVEWISVVDVEHPRIETVMVGTADTGMSGICFSRTGIEVSSQR